jgi:cytochrome c biogenesis protein CcmG/thiol:disulfide interchange protein DsbE
MRLALSIVVAAALAALLVVGLMQAREGSSASPGEPAGRFDLAQAREQLRGAPAPLASLHDQSNRVLSGGKRAFAARMAQLRGHPVVVNKWASWCAPCRAEFPAFQRVATEHGKRVAFLGVDGSDKRPAAERFLRDFPVPYPSYEDPSEAIARSIDAPANYPITVFVDAAGKTAFIHQGAYRSRADLAADVERYLK